MKISVVIPAYNEEALIKQCLLSVQRSVAAAHLSPNEYEIVVVNNASTDKTKEIAQSVAGVRVVDEFKKGITRARQAGFIAARGELIANLDADTLMPEGWITKVLQEFDDRALLALSGPPIYYDLSHFQRALVKMFIFVAFCSHLFNYYVLHKGAMLQGGNFVLRRSALEAIGGYDTSIEFYGEDTDIARRTTRIGKVKWTWRLSMPMSGRRLATEGLITTSWHYTLNYLSIIFLKKPVTLSYNDIRPTEKKEETLRQGGSDIPQRG
jgi:glycosyltransferase involved in cell wall biosynthesis